jgi:hypothetical protein
VADAADVCFCRFGLVTAKTNQGRGNPASTVPKMTTQTKEGKYEPIDARQPVRGAIIC